MSKILLLIFIVVPLIEIYLLIAVGSVIGPLATILLVLGTAVVGVYLLRQQAFSTVARLHSALQNGELPTTMMLEGVILLLCGALLLTPGFFTDTLGFMMLMPNFRRWAIEQIIARVTLSSAAHFNGSNRANNTPPEAQHGPRTIEGEFHRED